MKRELAFALGARSLILDTVGKTRSNRDLSAHSNGVSVSESQKRVKRAGGEQPVAFDCSMLEVEESGIRSSVSDEIKKDLIDNGVEHGEDALVEVDSKEVVSGLTNGLMERKCETEVETAADEHMIVDSSVCQVEEVEIRSNGCLRVEGMHFEETPAEVKMREARIGVVEKACEMELETAVVGTPALEDRSVVHVENYGCGTNGTDVIKEELRDQCTGDSNVVIGLVAAVGSRNLESGLGKDTVEKIPETEIDNGLKMEGSLVEEEVASPNGNSKSLAAKPQRRFTRSVLKVDNKDAVDHLDMETNLTSIENEESLVTVNLKHSSEVVLDVNEADFNEGSNVNGSWSESPNKLEVEDLKQTSITKIPRTVRELFETGILEGCKVFYNGGKKGAGMCGIIKGLGILCSCELCQGCKVVPPSQFEIHACKTYRRAAQYICLENGRSFLDILQLCRTTKLKSLEATVRNATGPLPEKQLVVCRICKESYSTSNIADADPLCNSCTIKLFPSQRVLGAACKTSGSPGCVSTSKSSGATPALNSVRERDSGIDRSPKPVSMLKSSRETSVLNSLRNRSSGTKRLPEKGSLMTKSSRSIQMAKISVGKAKASRKIKKSTKTVSIPKTSLRPRGKIGKRSKKPIPKSNSRKDLPLEGSSHKKAGKITRKDLGMHRLVFEDAGLPDGTELAYFARGKRILEGYKKDSGIFCRCCNEVVSASQFEAHAGFASRRKPYSYIYTSNGVSLHELAVSLLKSSMRAFKESDDLCLICAEGGELLLCDGCPRAFHRECASLTHHPRGKWFCRYCESAFERDRYVEWNVNAVAAGRVSGVDPIKQISNLSIRIVKDFQDDATSCYLCRGFDFSKSGFGPRTILLCDQCEREYHVGCLKTHKMADLKELPRGEWLCSTSCHRIRSSLQNLLSQEAERLPNTLVNVIRGKHMAQNKEIPTDFDVSWRLLSGQVSSEERAKTKPFLTQAISILHEGFGSIVDGVTGRDLIPSIVYGRKVGNREFRGMYCAVLLVNSLVVSVAVFRLFGEELVELPLVATRDGYRGKGYFEALFGCIQRLFAFHHVKSIVLPAAEGAEGVWLKFGFKRMTTEQVSDYKKIFWQITEFTGVVMLEKQVPECRVVNQAEDTSEAGGSA